MLFQSCINIFQQTSYGSCDISSSPLEYRMNSFVYSQSGPAEDGCKGFKLPPVCKAFKEASRSLMGGIHKVLNFIYTALLVITCCHTPSIQCFAGKFADAVAKKNLFIIALSDVKQEYQEWKHALWYFLGDSEVQQVIQAHMIPSDDEMYTVKGKYSTAIAGINIHDFYMSQLQVSDEQL